MQTDIITICFSPPSPPPSSPTRLRVLQKLLNNKRSADEHFYLSDTSTSISSLHFALPPQHWWVYQEQTSEEEAQEGGKWLWQVRDGLTPVAHAVTQCLALDCYICHCFLHTVIILRTSEIQYIYCLFGRPVMHQPQRVCSQYFQVRAVCERFSLKRTSMWLYIILSPVKPFGKPLSPHHCRWKCVRVECELNSAFRI